MNNTDVHYMTADDLDLVSCNYLIDKTCSNLISRLADRLVLDEHMADNSQVLNDIRCLSFVQTMRDLTRVEFDKSMTENGRNQ